MVVLIAALNIPYSVEFKNEDALLDPEHRLHLRELKDWTAMAEHSHSSIVRAQAEERADAARQKAEVPFDFAERDTGVLTPTATFASIPQKSIVDTRKELPKKAPIGVNVGRSQPKEKRTPSVPEGRDPSVSTHSSSSSLLPPPPLSTRTPRSGSRSRDISRSPSRRSASRMRLADRRSPSPGAQRGFGRRRVATQAMPASFENHPWKIVENKAANRGLFNAVDRSIYKGEMETPKCVGLLSMPTDMLPSSVKQKISNEMAAAHKCHPVYVEDAQFQGHYDHYCKEFLWPTFHCQIPDIPTTKDYEDHSWDDYVAVNQAIADKIVDVYEPGDIVWIHDYHLMLAPAMVREKLPKAAIGFFMHIAFPTSEVFRCLAYRLDLTRGLLAANTVCFQIEEYVQHFIMTAARLLAVDTSHGRIETKDHEVRVKACPIGIDVQMLERIATQGNTGEAMQRHREVIRKRWPTQRIIAARDKFDPVRGLTQKFKAFELFLQNHPDWADRVVLVQICIPGSGNDIHGSGLESLADNINSKYGDLAAGVQPVVLLRQDIRFEQYLALLAEADGFVVTCLREGMNLTCHEYVYMNQRRGPLILSEFTGSASVFGDDALLVNPWDIKRMSNAFAECLEMGPSERQHRSRRLLDSVTSHPGIQWVHTMTECIRNSWEDEMARMWLRPDIDHLRHIYKTRKGPRLFLLEIEPRYSAKERVHLRSYYATRLPFTIGELCEDPQNIVYVLSAESCSYMERVYRQHPGVGLIAEFGRYVRFAGTDEWVDLGDLDGDTDWHEELAPMIEHMRERLVIQDINVHESSIVLTMPSLDELGGKRDLTVVGEYTSVINDTFMDGGVKCSLEDDQLIIYTNNLGRLRLRACQKILAKLQETPTMSMLVSQGFATKADDMLFSWAEEQKLYGRTGELMTTVLGQHPTKAQFMLEGINALLSTLQAMMNPTS